MGKKIYGLGNVLIKERIITEEQLFEAQEFANEKRIRLNQALMELNMASEDILVKMLSKQLRIPVKRINEIQVDQTIVDIIPERIVKEHECFVFGRDEVEGTFKILVKDPLNLLLEDEIFHETGQRCEMFLGYEKEIDELVDKYYEEEKVTEAIEAFDGDDVGGDFFDVNVKDENSPIIKIVNSIFKGAVTEGASDIHMGVSETKIDIRYRIDGILHKVRELPKKAHAALVSRIKTMADMDITEKRNPQDGRIQINLDGKAIDMRVSTLPSVHGEKVTIRLLDKTSVILSMDQIGFQDKIREPFENLITTPIGIILITGPTGSGKSTTLYTIINEINDVSKNIVTIEDPVEYKIDGITQVQVNVKAGLTFASGLRAFLRQDPDIILVGEVRDAETAKIAVRASNTGHQVFATLHTNDAISSVLRLIEMGIEPYMVASTVMGVVNQRLVRRVCEHCKVSYKHVGFSPIRKFFGIADDVELTLHKGEGCEVCKHTGYKGRVAIHELLLMNDEIRKMITTSAHHQDIEKRAIELGMITLKRDGLEKALQGITTLEEIKRFVVE